MITLKCFKEFSGQFQQLWKESEIQVHWQKNNYIITHKSTVFHFYYAMCNDNTQHSVFILHVIARLPPVTISSIYCTTCGEWRATRFSTWLFCFWLSTMLLRLTPYHSRLKLRLYVIYNVSYSLHQHIP